MVLRRANGLGTTWIVSDTWVDTSAVVACPRGWAVSVRRAPNLARWFWEKEMIITPSSKTVKTLVIPIKSHRSSPLPEYPGLQVQTMTLHGSSSFTAQFAFLTQGLRWTHGLRHSPEKQACLDGQSPSVTQPGSSMTGSGTGGKNNKCDFKLASLHYFCWTYLECKQFHTDLQYSQGNMCNIPCDLWESSRQIVHIGRGPHTFHCHISGLLGSQDLSNTHMACSGHMDCQCGWACRCKWICGPSHCTKHFDRTVRRGKDPGTLDQNTPLSEGIHHLIYIQL